jgi:hypothetical protein
MAPHRQPAVAKSLRRAEAGHAQWRRQGVTSTNERHQPAPVAAELAKLDRLISARYALESRRILMTPEKPAAMTQGNIRRSLLTLFLRLALTVAGYSHWRASPTDGTRVKLKEGINLPDEMTVRLTNRRFVMRYLEA